MDEETVHTELVSALHGLQIDEIRDDNNPNVTKLVFPPSITRLSLSDKAWNLLGRYIANNTHLQELHFSGTGFSDATVVQLFQELTKSNSITNLNMGIFNIRMALRLRFGMAGVQSMLPFLQNSPQLVKLDLSGNGIGSQGFESVVNALDGRSINELTLDHCTITDISALGNVTLPCIKKISLYNNNIQNIGGDMSSYATLESLNLDKSRIGLDGCRALAYLLQKEGSSLKTLNLNGNGIDDEGVEVLANSLKHNKKLKSLHLRGRNLQLKGYLALLKLLLDISSIENTCNNSNHTITTLGLNPPNSSDKQIIKKMNTLMKCIHKNTTLNKHRHPGRAKVILTHLNSKNKKGLCELQGIEYSYESIFSEIDALVLPEVLAFVARSQKQTELFRMLVTVAPDLSSIVNRPAYIKERIVEYEREIAALDTKRLEMKRELESLQSRGETNDKEVQEDEKLSGKKRNRS